MALFKIKFGEKTDDVKSRNEHIIIPPYAIVDSEI